MSWIEVRAELPSIPEDWSPWIDLFVRHGVENTLQTDSPPSITACVVEMPQANAEIAELCSDLESAGAVRVTTGPYEEKDWEEAWKQFFKPRRVGKSFIVRPTWEQYETRPGDHVIVLDPGQAFGTGDHPTTRMCLELLEDSPVAGSRVLDLGCGSGILSIAARMLGGREVIAIDIDPLAVEVAKANAKVNGVDVRAAVSDGIPDGVQSREEYDLILSNIISAALIRLAPGAASSLRPGGRWIVSGILQANWNDVKKAAEKQRFVLIKCLEQDDWVAAAFNLQSQI